MSGSKIPIRFKVHVCLNHTKDIYQDNSETEIKNILQYNYDNSTFQKPNHLKRAKHVPNFLIFRSVKTAKNLKDTTF